MAASGVEVVDLELQSETVSFPRTIVAYVWVTAAAIVANAPGGSLQISCQPFLHGISRNVAYVTVVKLPSVPVTVDTRVVVAVFWRTLSEEPTAVADPFPAGNDTVLDGSNLGSRIS